MSKAQNNTKATAEELAAKTAATMDWQKSFDASIDALRATTEGKINVDESAFVTIGKVCKFVVEQNTWVDHGFTSFWDSLPVLVPSLNPVYATQCTRVMSDAVLSRWVEAKRLRSGHAVKALPSVKFLRSNGGTDDDVTDLVTAIAEETQAKVGEACKTWIAASKWNIATGDTGKHYTATTLAAHFGKLDAALAEAEAAYVAGIQKTFADMSLDAKVSADVLGLLRTKVADVGMSDFLPAIDAAIKAAREREVAEVAEKAAKKAAEKAAQPAAEATPLAANMWRDPMSTRGKAADLTNMSRKEAEKRGPACLAAWRIANA